MAELQFLEPLLKETSNRQTSKVLGQWKLVPHGTFCEFQLLFHD